MFFDMGYRDEPVLDEMSARFRPWLRRKMDSGEYLAWFAFAPDGSVAAGLGLWLMDWPPHMVAGAVILHASPDGRVLYESLGFAATNEMRLMLD